MKTKKDKKNMDIIKTNKEKETTNKKDKNFFNKNRVLIKALVTITLFFFYQIFEIIPVIIFNLDYSKISDTTTIILRFYDYIILAIILFIMYRKDIKKYLKDLKNRFITIIDKGFLYWTIGLIVMIISNIIIMKFFPIAKANNESSVQEIIKSLPILSIISVGILGPIIEEFTFRKAFYDIFKNKDLFIIISGLVFGLMHVVFSLKTGWDLLYVIPYGALGISFAYMYVKTDNLFTSMMMHMIHNTLLTFLSIMSLGL